MLKIGVLALQGSVAEHIKMLSKIDGVYPCEVRTAEEINMVSGLILPGGESTTMGKLLRDFQLVEPIAKRSKAGMPIWGTCAGMILLAKKIVDEEQIHLGLMDMSVRRNAYGGQLDSFNSEVKIEGVSPRCIPLVFIRAPWVVEVGKEVLILSELEGRVIAVLEGNLLATAFHPELTDNRQ